MDNIEELKSQLKAKEQECNRLKEEVSLLKESNSKLQQIEDVNSLEKCYLQQLDQLKAENEDLENQFKREKERFEKQDKFSAMFIQELKNEKSSLVNKYLKKIGQLQSENEELKEYIKHLHNLCGNETDKQYKYKQTLTEIKELLLKTPTDSQEHCVNAKSVILQKISECERNDEN